MFELEKKLFSDGVGFEVGYFLTSLLKRKNCEKWIGWAKMAKMANMAIISVMIKRNTMVNWIICGFGFV